MKVIAAYMLAVLGGKASPTAKDINAILKSVGITAEADRVNELLKQLEGKNLDQLIEEGSKKIVASGGGGGGGGGGDGGAAPAAAKGKGKPEEKKVEKKPESEEEKSEPEMGFSLFDE